MAEMHETKPARTRRVRHRGRGSQILIYLGKQLRFFVNESDWKVLPMAAVIAALVGMVIRKRFFINMEGSLIGGFALTCVAIWNGCFNSIQAVCRERAIIKREHRSGMHISSYVAAHMIYQFFLCALQTGLTMYVLGILGVQFPEKGFMTPWMMVDIGITMLLITYAADMLSLFISSISHTTTGAMTVMPFVLIFQLVFSGGIIPLPAWAQGLSDFTISNYGIRTVVAQSGYNELPMVTAWNTIAGMENSEVGGTFTVGQVLDLLKNPAIQNRRDMEVVKSYTVGEAAEVLSAAEEHLHLRDREITHPVQVRQLLTYLQTADEMKDVRAITLVPGTEGEAPYTLEMLLTELLADPEAQPLLDRDMGTTITLGEVLDFLHLQELAEAASDKVLNQPVTLGQIADFLTTNEAVQAQRDRTITLKATVGDLLDLFGRENVQQLIQQKTAAASQKEIYARTTDNIVSNWVMLGVFILVFAFLAMLALEFIDKDKR